MLYFRLLDTAEEEKVHSGCQVKTSLKKKISHIVYVVPKGYLNSRYVSSFKNNTGNVFQTQDLTVGLVCNSSKKVEVAAN